MACDSLAFMVIFRLFIMMTFQNRLSGIIVLLMQLLQAPSDLCKTFPYRLSSHNNNFGFEPPSFIIRPRNDIVGT